MTDPTPIISAHALSKVYRTSVDEVRVFHNISLDIRPGEAVAIVGQSGRGKTTLLNILSGLDRPTSGEVFYNGIRIDDLSEEGLSDFRNKNVGFVFQHHYLLEDFTALDNLLVPLRLNRGEVSASDIRLAKDWLDVLGLSKRQHHYPDQLSGGERQRVAIARALINEPLVLFADEPTGSLDKANSSQVERIIWDMRKKFRKTFVVATHNMEIAKKCDQVIDLG